MPVSPQYWCFIPLLRTWLVKRLRSPDPLNSCRSLGFLKHKQKVCLLPDLLLWKVYLDRQNSGQLPRQVWMFHIPSVLLVRYTAVCIASKYSLHKVALQVNRMLLLGSLLELKHVFFLVCASLSPSSVIKHSIMLPIIVQHCSDTWLCLFPNLCIPKQLSGLSSNDLVLSEWKRWFHLQIPMNSGSKSQFCSFMYQGDRGTVRRVPLTTTMVGTGSPIRHVVLQKTFIWLQSGLCDVLYQNHRSASLATLNPRRAKPPNLCNETHSLIEVSKHEHIQIYKRCFCCCSSS